MSACSSSGALQTFSAPSLRMRKRSPTSRNRSQWTSVKLRVVLKGIKVAKVLRVLRVQKVKRAMTARASMARLEAKSLKVTLRTTTMPKATGIQAKVARVIGKARTMHRRGAICPPTPHATTVAVLATMQETAGALVSTRLSSPKASLAHSLPELL